MKNAAIKIIFSGVIALAIFGACDSRNPISRSKTPVSFSAEITVIKDYTRRVDQAEVQFRRESQPYSGAKITIGADTLISNGNGIYSDLSPRLHLLIPTNTITFSSPADNYLKTVPFDLPDSFGIENISPQYDPNAYAVTVQWSHPNSASGYILSVISRDYPNDDTTPLALTLGAAANSFIVPDTTFENGVGTVEPGIYYIYLVAYNGGFGPYDGIQYPLPASLPSRSISDPNGHIRVGTVAPVDSIIVPL